MRFKKISWQNSKFRQSNYKVYLHGISKSVCPRTYRYIKNTVIYMPYLSSTQSSGTLVFLLLPGKSPFGATTQVHFRCELWEMVKIANLGIADLGVLEAWDRSGMTQASILAGLECDRTIGAVQTWIPESVNCASKISLYSWWKLGQDDSLRGLHALQGWI